MACECGKTFLHRWTDAYEYLPFSVRLPISVVLWTAFIKLMTW